MLFFGVKFKITPAIPKVTKPVGDEEEEEEEEEAEEVIKPSDSGTGEVMVSCVGIGYSNVNKAMA